MEEQSAPNLKEVFGGKTYVHHYSYKFYILPHEARNLNECADQVIAWKNGWHQSMLYSITYLSLIYMGHKWMKKRNAFDLKKSLVSWNGAMSMFSILGSFRFLPHALAAYRNEGFHYSVCVCDYYCDVVGYWTELFGFAKVLELFDTLFLVLRKKPVSFIHWFHHATVLVFTWHGIGEMSGPGRWFVGMNFTVHAIMYPYYTLRALGFRVPKPISISITLLQIAQMVVGVYLSWYVWNVKSRGEDCHQSNENLMFAIFIYSVYLCLFVKFFADAYLKTNLFERLTGLSHRSKESLDQLAYGVLSKDE